MSKSRVDVYISPKNFFKLLEYQAKHGIKTYSQTIERILSEFFTGADNQALAVDRLNKIIQDYENKIRNLELENRLLKTQRSKILKEGNKDENK